jgi:hypothetical protein
MPRAKQGRIIRPTKQELRGIRAASVLVINAATQASSSSPRDTTTQGAQHRGTPGGRPASPSPTARRQGQAVEEHERRGNTEIPTATPRPTRITKNTSSLNVRVLSRKSRSDWPTTSTQSTDSLAPSQNLRCLSNPFSILDRDSRVSSSMDIDASDKEPL